MSKTDFTPNKSIVCTGPFNTHQPKSLYSSANCSTDFLKEHSKPESKNMGKNGSNKKSPNLASGPLASITLREESSGKKQTNANAKSILKLQHIKNLAVWASGEASIPSFGAFFGHLLAACGEATGIPPDPSLFPCQRCESILQPGYNCTVRIEKNRGKVRRRRKKPNNSTQNNVVYKCHFCLHQNLKRGTPRGYMKDICPSKAKPSSKPVPANSMVQKSVGKEKGSRSNVEMDEIAPLAIDRDDPVTGSPATPLVKTRTTLLEGKRKKRNRSGVKKLAESESTPATINAETAVSTSSKRRRKSWTSLKEIAESVEHDNSRDFTKLTVPFFI